MAFLVAVAVGGGGFVLHANYDYSMSLAHDQNYIGIPDPRMVARFRGKNVAFYG